MWGALIVFADASDIISVTLATFAIVMATNQSGNLKLITTVL